MMQRLLFGLSLCCLVSGCLTTRPTPRAAQGWDQRVVELQQLHRWQLDGRAAVAVGTQGWQATLNWREDGAASEVHLAGPFGVGALTLKNTPGGLSLNGAPPSDAVLAQLQDKLGFELPLEDLRFWLLGVPNPATPFDLVRNDQDRASKLTQDGWSIEYDRYKAVQSDSLPAHMVLSRDLVRVRIAIDHWLWQ